MEYITILESENSECPNVGTITLNPRNWAGLGIDNKFKFAVESHFDAKLISFSFVDEQIESLGDCINASPIDVLVKLDGVEGECRVELSQTWLY